MNKPLVSIIVPVYNVEKYLEKCIESIINQSYKNIEIILVDDGSQDKSSKICDEYKLKDNRIITIHKKNGGVSTARNIGLKKAKGKYIQFIDSDDYIEKNMVEVLVKSLDNTEYDLAICGIRTFCKDKRLSEEKLDLEKKVYSFEQYLDILHKVKLGLICGSPVNKLYINSIIKSNSIKFMENISYAEDFMFNMEYLKYVNLINVENLNNSLYNYRKEERESLTSKKRNIQSWWKVQNIVYKSYKELFIEKKIYEKEKSKVDEFFYYLFYVTIFDLIVYQNNYGFFKKKKIIKEIILENKNEFENAYIIDKKIKIIKFFIDRRWYLLLFIFIKLRYYILR